MDIDNLKAFIHVTEQGSFSRAAETLFITQPAVSKRVANLESQLGTTLFDRIGHSIILTESGQALLPRARRILLELKDCQRVVANLNESIKGPVMIGTSHHIGLHRLPPVLRKFTREFPDVQLNIQFMDSEEACHAVMQGDIEIGIVTLPLSPHPELKLINIWHDPLVLVAPKGHALTKQKTVQLQALATHNAILPATGTFTREVLERTLAPLSIELQVGMSTNYLETIKMLVSVGLGWSILPKAMLDNDVCELKNSTIKMERNLGIVTHTQRTQSNAAGALISTLEKFREK